jgi:hypothetical protein
MSSLPFSSCSDGRQCVSALSLSLDPFTDIGRTIPEFRSLGLAESKEFHGFSVDKKNVFEIDGEAARFLFQCAPKHVDMIPCNLAAYKQHHQVFRTNDSINSAVHLGQRATHAAATPLVFQVSQALVSRKNVRDPDSPLCVTRIRSRC